MNVSPKWTGVLLATSLVAVAIAQQALEMRRERSGPSSAAKDALEGKAPPELLVSSWTNTDGKTLQWKDLKGKVVLIDFWAHW